MDTTTIIVIDNNPSFLTALCDFLERQGFRTIRVATYEDGKRILEQNEADLAITDMRLINDLDERDFSGVDLAKEAQTSVPIIIYSNFPTWQAVREALGMRVNGLPVAVYFAYKPDGDQSLLTAVRKQLKAAQKRRREQQDRLSKVDTEVAPPSSQTLRLDTKKRHLMVDDRAISLTPQEFDLVDYFFKNAGRVVTRDDIRVNVLHEGYSAYENKNRINNMIHRLREKFEVDPSNPEFLQTVRGHGFMLVLEPQSSQ